MRRIASVYLRLVLAALICGVVLMAESGLVAADPIDRDGLGAQSLALSGLTTLNDSPLVAAQLPSAAWDTAGTWALALRSGFSHGHLTLGAPPPASTSHPQCSARRSGALDPGLATAADNRLNARSSMTPSVGPSRSVARGP